MSTRLLCTTRGFTMVRNLLYHSYLETGRKVLTTCIGSRNKLIHLVLGALLLLIITPSIIMWPKSNHGFFMHKHLLKSTAGRRKQSRYKGSAKGGTSTKRKHECPICHGFGHRWYTCKNGDPADIAAMLADR